MDQVRAFLGRLHWAHDLIDAYLQLMEHGALNASELRERMKKDPGKDRVYEIIKDLIKRGAIAKVEGHRKGQGAKVEAFHPRNFFPAVTADLQRLMEAALQEAEQTYEARTLGAVPLPDKAVTGMVGVEAAVLSELDTCQERFLVADGQLRWLTGPATEKLARKNTGSFKAQVLSDGGKAARKLLLKSKGIPIRSAEKIPLAFVVADNNVILIQSNGESATISRNAAFAEFMAYQFDLMFKAREE